MGKVARDVGRDGVVVGVVRWCEGKEKENTKKDVFCGACGLGMMQVWGSDEVVEGWLGM